MRNYGSGPKNFHFIYSVPALHENNKKFITPLSVGLGTETRCLLVQETKVYLASDVTIEKDSGVVNKWLGLIS